MWFAFFIAGLAWWTLVEYVLHRFFFHDRIGKYVGRRHIAHHANLMKRRLAIAPVPSMVVGLLLHGALFRLLFGAHWLPLFAGLVAGYAWYEWIHYGTHYRVAATPVGRYLRAYHLAHHHKSPRARFGVTSPAWDVAFGTYEAVPRGSREAAT